MKKVLMLMLTLLFLVSGVNAGSFLYQDQNRIDDLIDIGEGYNQHNIDIFGSDNLNRTIGNDTQIFDIAQQFVLTDKLYWEYEGISGEELEVYVNWGGQDILTKYTINIEQNGTYNFMLNPSSEKEFVEILINYPNARSDVIEFRLTRERGLTDVLVIFTNKATELMDYNLLLWELSIYFATFGVIIFLLFSAINFLISLHKKIREAKEAKEARLNERRRKRD